MTTNRFGYFDRRPKAEAIAELESLRSNSPQENEAMILKYLQSGTQVVAVAGLATDLLSLGGDIIGPPNEFSDGVWSWTSDVIYYVERYHIRLADDFIAHMKRNNWIPTPIVNKIPIVASTWVT